MRFQNPHYISPLQKKKIKEIADMAKHNMNPLRVTQFSDAAGYGYSIRDICNYFESINKPFDLIVR